MGAVLGYARVSTGDQDVAGQTLRLEQAGAIKVFTDVKSGKSMDRPGLADLIAYARAGDTLAIVRLDRLGRSLAELLETVKMLRERQIDLLSLEEKIDTSSAAGELIFHVFGAIAHFERRLISERTKDGIAAARVKGKLPGRQPLDMKRVEAAIKLIEAKTSPTEAARQLGLGRSTVYREMRRLYPTTSLIKWYHRKLQKSRNAAGFSIRCPQGTPNQSGRLVSLWLKSVGA